MDLHWFGFNANPNPNTGLDGQKLEKITVEKFLFLASLKNVQASRKDSSPQKENI
jgi:hypothetical protein